MLVFCKLFGQVKSCLKLEFVEKGFWIPYNLYAFFILTFTSNYVLRSSVEYWRQLAILEDKSLGYFSLYLEFKFHIVRTVIGILSSVLPVVCKSGHSQREKFFGWNPHVRTLRDILITKWFRYLEFASLGCLWRGGGPWQENLEVEIAAGSTVSSRSLNQICLPSRNFRICHWKKEKRERVPENTEVPEISYRCFHLPNFCFVWCGPTFFFIILCVFAVSNTFSISIYTF